MTGRAATLLAWYRRQHRTLPWRAPPGVLAEPYRVWLSEIMLQQTTVTAVIPYFQRFLQRWPSVEALAAADPDQFLAAWAGLGYYARARNLRACAQEVVAHHGGRFPDTEEGLRALPGIGAYTAAAIAAIAFGRKATVVDGNVERVVARLFAVQEPLPAAKSELRRLAATLTPERHSGDFAQAMMDLGATLCTPRRPRCLACPLHRGCAAAEAGLTETLPRRAPRAERPVRRGVAYWLVDGEGAVLLRKRAAKGLLGGMTELPSTSWCEGPPPTGPAIAEQAPAAVPWRVLPGTVHHTFTHFHLELTLVGGSLPGSGARSGAEGFWVPPARLDDQALPSVMRKLIRHALAHQPDGQAHSSG